MNLPDGLLSAPWLWLGHLAYAAILLAALATAPWARLRDGGTQSVFFGTVVVLLLLWSLDAGVTPGLHVHFLGVTALTLMFGWQFAVMGTGLVVLGLALNGAVGWEAGSLNALLMGAVPAFVTIGVYRASVRWLPAHFFVYVFVGAFLAAALAVAGTAFMTAALLIAAGVYPAAQVANEFLPILVLLMLPEAVLNGMIMTVLVIYRPAWVASFDDARYFGRG